MERRSVLLDVPFLNWHHISIMAQPLVGDLVQQCKNYSVIKKMYIFGSCTEPRWIPVRSDIDIYLEGCSQKDIVSFGFSDQLRQRATDDVGVFYEVPLDIFCQYDSCLDGSAVQKKMKEGVLVYERNF